MREVILHIGLPGVHPERVQQALEAARDRMARGGAVFPRSPGRANHVRLWMAATDPARPCHLRAARGHADPAAQEALREKLVAQLRAECAEADRVVLSCVQLPWLIDPVERGRLREMLSPLGRVTVLAHLAPQAHAMAALIEEQARLGRTRGPEVEDGLKGAADWWAEARAAMPERDAAARSFPEVEGPAPWLDYGALKAAWEGTFGDGAFRALPYDEDRWRDDMPGVLAEGFGLTELPARAPDWTAPARPSAATLARSFAINRGLAAFEAKGMSVGPRMRSALLADIAVDGPPFEAARLGAAAKAAARRNGETGVKPAGPRAKAFRPPEAGQGFRASAWLLAWRGRIEAAARADAQEKGRAAVAALATIAADPGGARLTPAAERLLPPLAKKTFPDLARGRFAPHDRMSPANEGAAPAPWPEVPRAPDGRPFVVVGCMKDEAPYIVEWVAHHRAVGFDGFLIYTNGCTDPTDAMLGRLMEMGVVEHRLNDDWKGNSPQQYALNRAMREPLIEGAEWVAHIDVDEFVNVRAGDGTIQWFLDQVPGATNVAMTWRLFGNGGVRDLVDRPVTEQFEWAAPKFLPKPHTGWGFKTLTKMTGAYAKLSCHRPNKLADGASAVWVNGSGKRMAASYAEAGWRSDLKSVGYDLLQLNHYALRSAESFLVKRQRGRALHVDRAIGLNYWVRMDWSDVRDRTIQANGPRVRAEIDRLMADPELARLHAEGVAWHRERAEALRAVPEFRELWDRALEIELTPTERVAWALALDMES